MPGSLLLGRSGAATAGGGAYESGSPSAPVATYHFTKDGLVLWLKADAITGLVDNDPVTTWSDSSGNGNDATQATGDNKPLYKTNIQNGLPIVRFDGSNDQLRTPSITLAQPLTILAVVARIGVVGSYYVFLDGGVAGPQLSYSDLDYARLHAGAEVVGTTTVGTAFHTWAATVDGASSSIILDGKGYATGNAGAVGYTDSLRIGTNAGETFFFSGDLGELLIYGGALSLSVRGQVQRYLGNKWGITIG